MDAGDRVELARVRDAVDLGRIGEHAARAITHYRIVFPAAFPQLVADFQIFLRQIVAIVVAELARQAHVARGAVEIRGDDVPANAPAGQMIEGRHAACEWIRVLVGQRTSDAKTEMLGHLRQQRHQQQRIVDRHLRRHAQRSVMTALIDVVDAEHISQEQTVEFAAFERAREIDPVSGILVTPGLIARMGPQAGRLMADAIHGECVEADFLRHWATFRRASKQSAGRPAVTDKGPNATDVFAAHA